jgi:hypothetical protein
LLVGVGVVVNVVEVAEPVVLERAQHFLLFLVRLIQLLLEAAVQALLEETIRHQE